MLLEISAMLLMIADRRAYIYRGDPSALGWWMVRISNFLVFFLTLVVIYGFNLYLIDLYTHEGGLEAPPRRLKAARALALAGMAMVVVSQFTGLYYTFDDANLYQRSPGFIVCYLFPLAIMALQISVVVQFRRRLSRRYSASLLLYLGVSITASILQVFVYGISLNNMTIALMAALLYIFALKDMNSEVARARAMEIESYRENQKREHALFEQTTEALAMAIDAKDKYTHGHSTRVAMYSTRIAREAGKSDEECEHVYFAALLHDVGKIGVPDTIINKDGRLTDEEFAQIKRHTVYGNQILLSIQASPYLSIGAHYHHERYDGRGYPEGLKGEDIPDIARIISVADSYDAMTSKRSYRDPIPQQKVREELVKGMGAQFDPEYAKIMLHLIDKDIEYSMREREAGQDDTVLTHLRCESLFHDCTVGIPVNEKPVSIRLYSRGDEGFPADQSLPTLVLFDALDGRVHQEPEKRKDLLYFEYGRIRLDGRTLCEGARKIACEAHRGGVRTVDARYSSYIIEAARVKDHALVRVTGPEKALECVVALPDSSRFTYISITGEHCNINNIGISRAETPIDPQAIPRIAEEISYIKGCPQGDVPNVQIDGWCTDATQGVPVRGALKLAFHARSLPTARLVWHCPYVSLFTSGDGRVRGEGYREFMLLRLDGETWESDAHAENAVRIDHTHGFPGWNAWKDANRQGLDCEVTIRREGNRVVARTENLGIAIESVTTVKDDVSDIFVALTGDQCALTDIHVTPLPDAGDGATASA